MNKKYVVILMAALASLSFATRIGVLKNGSFKCNEEVVINLDVEDYHNHTKLSGEGKAPGIIANSHVIFNYCVKDVAKAPSASFDYVVLRLDDECPKGSYAFARKHDCENSHNANSKTGNYYPSVIGKDAVLEYCFVPATSSTTKYPFSKGYGVFANPDPAIEGISQYTLYVDDEDDYEGKCNLWPIYGMVEDENGNLKSEIVGYEDDCSLMKDRRNGDKWIWHTDKWNLPSGFRKGLIKMKEIMTDIAKIMYGDGNDENTYYKVVKWDGSALAKSAASDPVEAPSADLSTPIETKVTSASIQSVNREAVGFELESAGNAEVFLVGVNGRVFAKASAANLQAGFNTLNWNAANVPADRYIVCIKHNGAISAKKVLLK